MPRNVPTDSEPKDPNEEFLLIEGNWLANTFEYGRLKATRAEIARKGYNADALLKQGVIRPIPKPAPAPEPQPAPEAPKPETEPKKEEKAPEVGAPKK